MVDTIYDLLIAGLFDWLTIIRRVPHCCNYLPYLECLEALKFVWNSCFDREISDEGIRCYGCGQCNLQSREISCSSSAGPPLCLSGSYSILYSIWWYISSARAAVISVVCVSQPAPWTFAPHHRIVHRCQICLPFLIQAIDTSHRRSQTSRLRRKSRRQRMAQVALQVKNLPHRLSIWK